MDGISYSISRCLSALIIILFFFFSALTPALGLLSTHPGGQDGVPGITIQPMPSVGPMFQTDLADPAGQPPLTNQTTGAGHFLNRSQIGVYPIAVTGDPSNGYLYVTNLVIINVSVFNPENVLL